MSQGTRLSTRMLAGPGIAVLEGLLPVDDWLRHAHAEWSDRLDRLEIHLAAQAESTITEENPDA